MKILIVDDKPENAYLLESLLKGNGYETVSAKNGAEALTLALKSKPELIISDILMPVMDGFSFCRECKKNNSLENIPFIFYTATYTDSKDEEFALSLGADRFILKPQDPEVFVGIIKDLMKELKNNKIRPSVKSQLPEEVVLQKYNATLIRKLEDKLAQVEKTENELRRTNIELEKEIEEHKLTLEKVNLLAAIVQSADDAIFSKTLNGIITSWNPGAEKIYGYSEEEVIGKPVTMLVPPEHEDEIEQILEKIKSGKHIENYEALRIRKDGRNIIMSLTISPIKNRYGEIIAASTIGYDITEIKKAREELIRAKEKAEKSDKLKSEFLAQISHEIRSPMNVITNFSKMLKDSIANNDFVKLSELLAGIELSSHRIIRTIELIINMSEMHLGTYEPTWQNIDLVKDVFSLIENEFELKARSKGVILNFKYSAKDTTLYGDQYSINQILVNLLDNAVKYTEEGRIDVDVSRDKYGKLKIVIQDTGIGISEDYKHYLFEPFMQEERGYSRGYEGNGLGLALVKKYCDLNKIKISLESEKGKGTKFTLNFSK